MTQRTLAQRNQFRGRLGAAFLLVAALAAGCASYSTYPTAAGTSSLDATLASAIDASGTLLCAPSQAQLDACTGLAAGDACMLTARDGITQIAGTCRTTVDGAAVACAPNPKGPPHELVEACTGKAIGDACQVTAPDDDDVREGVCMTARDGTTIICGRPRTPPQAAIDACVGLAAGDACTIPNCHQDDATADDDHHDGDDDGARAGVCSLGPASTGPLACERVQDLRRSATEACAGLAVGAACTVGRHDEVSGTCITPAAGGDALCVPACADLGGRFACHEGPGGHWGGGGGHHGGH